MSLQAVRPVINDLEDTLIKANKNDTCLYPNCSDPPIGSHVIARKILKLLADTGQVLTWSSVNTSLWDMAKNLEAGIPWKYALSKEPVRVGIKDVRKVKYPLFCHHHDENIFAPLEKQEFSFDAEQVVLLAYRALCYSTFGISSTRNFFTAIQKRGYQSSFNTSDKLAKLARFHALDVLLEVRQQYEHILIHQEYDQLGWSIYSMNTLPCVATTHALIPVEDDEAKSIVNGTQILTKEDVVSFSLLPCSDNKSICVVSWLKGSQRAQRFITVNKFNELSEKDQQKHFLSLAFDSHALYVSPKWWQSLKQEERNEYEMAQADRGREYAELV